MERIVPPALVKARLSCLRQGLAKDGMDSILIAGKAGVHYYSGFTGDDSMLLVGRKSAWLLTDFRYQEEADRTMTACETVIWRESLPAAAAELLRKTKAKKCGYDEFGLSAWHYQLLRKAVGGIKLVPAAKVANAPRAVKDAWEIGKIRSSLAIAEKAMTALRRVIKVGITELDVVRELEYLLRKMGAQDKAFPVIAAEGANASLPHAQPGARKLKRGSLLLIDWGARDCGYASDLTRTMFLGSIAKCWSKRYEIVLKAQQAGIDAVAAGKAGWEVDEAARQVLRQDGLDHLFGHGLGHGVGLEVHESPSLGKRGKAALVEGNVVTVEPGVYLPGKGGIRIEDMVLVRQGGAEVLSSLPKSLEWSVING